MKSRILRQPSSEGAIETHQGTKRMVGEIRPDFTNEHQD